MLDDKWTETFLAVRPTSRNTIDTFSASRLREIRKEVSEWCHSPLEWIFYIFIYIYFFLVSLRAKSGSQYYKIVFLRGKTATLVSALRRNDHTVRLRTHFSKEHNRFPSYFSFTAICFFSCFSLICGFKHSDNSWHLIGHFCKKSIILIINKVVMPGQL